MCGVGSSTVVDNGGSFEHGGWCLWSRTWPCAKAQSTNPLNSAVPAGKASRIVDPRVRNQKFLETKINYIHVAERTLGKKKNKHGVI